jgi:hypothetical protein
LPQSPLEAAGQDQLQDQWFGNRGKAVAYSELEAERVAVVVDNAVQRMILPGERFEIGEPAVTTVVFNRECPGPG